MMIPSCERNLVIDAFREGARGVFCRDHSSELLPKCIRTVHEGQIWAGNEEIEHILNCLHAAHPVAVVTGRQYASPD